MTPGAREESHATELPLPLDSILANAYVSAGDAVFAAGSLIEGIGNAFSDLDVYVVTTQRPSAASIDYRRHYRVISTAREILRGPVEGTSVCLIHTVFADSPAKLDVEFVTTADATILFERVRRLYDYAAKNLVLMTARLVSREELFVHRLFHCRPLIRESAICALRAQLNLDQYCYLAYRWVASDFSVLLDVIGAWQKGEWPRAVDIARGAVVRESLGLLHLLRCTRIGYKWVPVYMNRCARLPPEFKAEFAYLFCPDQLAGQRRKREYVVRALDYLDTIFMLSRELLEENPAAPSGEAALRLLRDDHNYADHSSRYAKLEYAYRAKVYGIDGLPSRAYLDV
jgi:hypothetical protein